MEKSVFVPHENLIFYIKIKNYQNRCSLKGGSVLGKKRNNCQPIFIQGQSLFLFMKENEITSCEKDSHVKWLEKLLQHNYDMN